MEHSVKLSDYQKKKLNTAFRKGKAATVKLAYSALSGSDRIFLTQQQSQKLQKAKATGKGVELSLSKTQLSKHGGFLPFLLVPALVAAAKAAALGAAGAAGAAAVKGIADAVQKKKGSGIKRKKGPGLKKKKGRGLFVPGKH